MCSKAAVSANIAISRPRSAGRTTRAGFADVIVRVPGGQSLVIDAKVSLNSYRTHSARSTKLSAPCISMHMPQPSRLT